MEKAKHLFFIFGIISVFIFLTCNRENHNNHDTIPQEIDNAIWPFEVGSWWILDVWDNEVSGEPFEYSEKYSVDSAFMHNNRRVALIRFEQFTPDTVFGRSVIWWGNTSGGLFMFAPYGNSFEPYSSPKLLFKHPATDGESFSSYSIDSDNPDMMFCYLSGVPDVEVPAGIFSNCVFYMIHRSPATDHYYYFKPDTGYVMMERKIGEATVKTRKLKTFHLEKID